MSVHFSKQGLVGLNGLSIFRQFSGFELGPKCLWPNRGNAVVWASEQSYINKQNDDG